MYFPTNALQRNSNLIGIWGRCQAILWRNTSDLQSQNDQPNDLNDPIAPHHPNTTRSEFFVSDFLPEFMWDTV